MHSETVLREQIGSLLRGGHAHLTLTEAVRDFPHSHFNTLFPHGTYSSWDLLEHIRITQADILDFIVNSTYKELEWPKDYWPKTGTTATSKEWEHSLQKYAKDLSALERLAFDPKLDLYAKIPWGSGQIALQEFFVVADHTSYHLGEFAIIRQVMGTWGKEHK